MAKNIGARFAISFYLLSLPTTMLKLLIQTYQLTRFLRPSCCRFYPSCSDYCLQAINEYGWLQGLFLAGQRLLKCHPWHPGGIDLVLTANKLGSRGLADNEGKGEAALIQ